MANKKKVEEQPLVDANVVPPENEQVVTPESDFAKYLEEAEMKEIEAEQAEVKISEEVVEEEKPRWNFKQLWENPIFRFATIFVAALIVILVVRGLILGLDRGVDVVNGNDDSVPAAPAAPMVEAPAAPAAKESEVQEPIEQAPVAEVEEVQADPGNDVPSNDGELSFPKPLPFPNFVGNKDAWMMLLPKEREQKVSEVIGVTVNEVEGEEGVAYAFNADGVSLTDMVLIPYLLYEVHIDSGEILYFLSDDEASLSDYDGRTTGDATVRIEGFLSAERSDGLLCLPYWHSYEYNTRYGRAPTALGYFAKNCADVPEAYVSEPDLKDKFEFLYKETKADLTMLGEREGVWYFWSDQGSQKISCPDEWTCIATTQDVKGDVEYNLFTDTVDAATAAYLFDPDVLQKADIDDFIEEAGLVVK